MGAWGITVRQSDDGLDLLDTIVAEQLREAHPQLTNNQLRAGFLRLRTNQQAAGA